MSIALLNFINEKMEELNINYEFGQWSIDPVPDPYFVGEYAESDTLEREESGLQDGTFIITGTSRSWLLLEQEKEKIEKNISQTAILPSGNGIAIFYAGALIIPTGDAELKRIQININTKEWSVNI